MLCLGILSKLLVNKVIIQHLLKEIEMVRIFTFVLLYCFCFVYQFLRLICGGSGRELQLIIDIFQFINSILLNINDILFCSWIPNLLSLLNKLL